MSGYFGYPDATAYSVQLDAAAAAANYQQTMVPPQMTAGPPQSTYVPGAYPGVYGAPTGGYTLQPAAFQQLPQPVFAPPQAAGPTWQPLAAPTVPPSSIYVPPGNYYSNNNNFMSLPPQPPPAQLSLPPPQPRGQLQPSLRPQNPVSLSSSTGPRQLEAQRQRPMDAPRPRQLGAPRPRLNQHQAHQQNSSPIARVRPQSQTQIPQTMPHQPKSNLVAVSVDSATNSLPASTPAVSSASPVSGQQQQQKQLQPLQQQQRSQQQLPQQQQRSQQQQPQLLQQQQQRSQQQQVQKRDPVLPNATKAPAIGSAAAASAIGKSTAPTVNSGVKPTAATAVATPKEDQLLGAVGIEYVVQIRTEGRGAAALQFHCRLCDCRFTDPQARDLHVKGRRHRLQFKRKVDPRLDVDAKPSVKGRRSNDSAGVTASGMSSVASLSTSAGAAAIASEAAARVRRLEDARLREMQKLEWSNYVGCKTTPGFWGGGSGPSRRPETNDDRHVLAKHSSVYPTEAELQSVQQLVTRCERALKLVSDQLSTERTPAPLRGVMRVGVLAKGLLLHGDLSSQLVLLCADRPTRELRDRVVQLLPGYLEQTTEPEPVAAPEASGSPDRQQKQPEVRVDDEEGSVVVTGGPGAELVCSVYMTSPAVREEQTPENPDASDLLDKEKCLEALAALRQAKWFQAKASSLQSCVVVVRVMRDLGQRLPIWNPLSEWAMELLVERSISSANGPLSPGEALRRVMECLAAGILLPGGPGLRDPCEKSAIDAAAALSAQEREDITASAQQALRLIAYRQIHRVLDMEPLASTSASALAGAKRPATTAAVASTQGANAKASATTSAKTNSNAVVNSASAAKQPRLA